MKKRGSLYLISGGCYPSSAKDTQDYVEGWKVDHTLNSTWIHKTDDELDGYVLENTKQKEFRYSNTISASYDTTLLKHLPFCILLMSWVQGNISLNSDVQCNRKGEGAFDRTYF